MILTEDGAAYQARNVKVEDQALVFTANNVPVTLRKLATPGYYATQEPDERGNYSPSATGVRVHLKPGADIAQGQTSVPFSDIAQLDVFSVDSGVEKIAGRCRRRRIRLSWVDDRVDEVLQTPRRTSRLYCVRERERGEEVEDRVCLSREHT